MLRISSSIPRIPGWDGELPSKGVWLPAGCTKEHSVIAATKGPFTSWRDGSYSPLQVCVEDSRCTQQFLVLCLHVAARSNAYTMLTWTIHQTFRKPPSYLWAMAHSCFSLKKKIGSVLHWVTRRWLSGQQNHFHYLDFKLIQLLLQVFTKNKSHTYYPLLHLL